MPISNTPGAGAWVPSDPSLPALRAAAQACRGCELYRDASQAVMGSGSTDAALMVVGEQPGDQEDQLGEPFVEAASPAGMGTDHHAPVRSAALAEPQRGFRPPRR